MAKEYNQGDIAKELGIAGMTINEI
jgi:DNA-binding XRE family transcriptional regulator